jgi:hypothetical protein
VLNMVETTQPGQGPQMNINRSSYAKWWTGRTLGSEKFSEDNLTNYLQFKTPSGDKIGAFTGELVNKIGNEERARLAASNTAAFEECVRRTGNVKQCSVPAPEFVRQQLASTLNPNL